MDRGNVQAGGLRRFRSFAYFGVNLAQSVLVAYEFKRQITYAVIGVRTEDFLYTLIPYSRCPLK